jgi:hypothetical protein
MNYQHVTCDWIMQPLAQPNLKGTSILNTALQMSQEAGCTFRMARPFQDNEGLYIMLLIWRGASQELINKTIEEIQTYMRLRNLRIATQDEIELLEQLMLSSDTGLLALIHFIDEAGLHNNELLAKNRNNGN